MKDLEHDFAVGGHVESTAFTESMDTGITTVLAED